MSHPDLPRFDSVVFAGGGSRCFWHAGFWREVQGPLALAPKQIASVSAAGSIACALNAGIGEDALRLFQAATRANPRNFYPRNVFGKNPVFPHERMYRRAVLELFDPAALARVHAGPEIRLLLGHVPRWLGPRTGALAAAAAYNFDKRVRRVVHPTLPLALGFRPEVVSVRECATPEELADLILASSCSPPMTSLRTWKGRYVLDGGVVDNVPVCALDDAPGETLVMLTRRYPKLPDIPGRTYVQPSMTIAVSAWDYTSPEKLQSAYDLGRRDGEAFVRARKRATAETPPLQRQTCHDRPFIGDRSE
ncbi:MAG: patatin-like phospholipase family protein [Acidobacteria bacterium]|nr:patatin-like phospholipase family protein [Acidobacteriota bacterium]